jgi:hypothetical protein
VICSACQDKITKTLDDLMARMSNEAYWAKHQICGHAYGADCPGSVDREENRDGTPA